MMVRLIDVLEGMAPTPALAAGAREWVFDGFEDYIDESTAALLTASIIAWTRDIEASEVESDIVLEADRCGAYFADASYGCIIFAY